MLIAQQVIVTVTFPLHHPHQRLNLHKICYFQPFVKLKLSKNFHGVPPFAKIPKMSRFLGLGNKRLRCVRSIVSGAKPLSLKCLIRTFVQVVFCDVRVAVGPQPLSNCCGKKHFTKPILEGKFGR